jgi:hypothetical protein
LQAASIADVMAVYYLGLLQVGGYYSQHQPRPCQVWLAYPPPAQFREVAFASPCLSHACTVCNAKVNESCGASDEQFADSLKEFSAAMLSEALGVRHRCQRTAAFSSLT